MVISNLFTFVVITYLFLLFCFRRWSVLVMSRSASGRNCLTWRRRPFFVDDNGQVLKLKWGGGKGCLTNSVIASLTVFYGEAIRNFPGDVDGMYRAIWAVFHHSLSNDEKHDHQFCPSGSDSWCKFNRALANNEEPPKQTPKLPIDLSPFIKPVFTELSKLELLEKCVLGATQNQNESFNNIVWSRCPKTGFCSCETVEIAVYLAAITFNHGWKDSCLCLWSCLDFLHLALQLIILPLLFQSGSESLCRRQRTPARNGERWCALLTEERHVAREGVTYESGGFWLLGVFFIFKVFFLIFIWSNNYIYFWPVFICMCEWVCVWVSVHVSKKKLSGQPTIFLTGFFFYSHTHSHTLIFLSGQPTIYFLPAFLKANFWIHPAQLAYHTISKRLKLCIQYRARHHFIEGWCSTLKLSFIYIHLISNFIIFFYLRCTYRHSKLKKGMEVPEH